MRRTPDLEEKFQEAIATWLKSDWAELVPRGDISGFFIPAFIVVRIDKATTKYRLILNGASEFGGRCINDFLLAGPSRMNKLWDILVRSRRCLYVLACDIESMFLNIKVDEEGGDPRYLRLLFRDPRTGQERALQCLTHVFGLTQSPYVAMEVVRHHVFKYRAQYPYAEQAVRKDIIMDDIIHSTNSKEKLMRTQAELMALFEKASMNIHKWATNLPQLWARLPETSRAKSYTLAPEEDQLFCRGPTEGGPLVKASSPRHPVPRHYGQVPVLRAGATGSLDHDDLVQLRDAAVRPAGASEPSSPERATLGSAAMEAQMQMG